MAQEKIIRIFSPASPIERQNIGWSLEGYINKIAGYRVPIKVESFKSFLDLKGVLSIGFAPESQLVYVIDKHSVPQAPAIPVKPRDENEKRVYNLYKWDEASYQGSLKLLDEKDIPYIGYAGEFAEIRNERKVILSERDLLEEQFLAQFEVKTGKESVREKMLRRLKMIA